MLSPLGSLLEGKVADKQSHTLVTPPLTYTGSFTRSHGLPCLHTLKSLQEQGQVLSLGHFHQHWRLQRKGAPQPLLEPRQRIESTFAHSNIPKQSTRREPSAFESVEMAREAPPTCSRWCLDYKQMSKRCTTSTSSREWTKEEMMAYLDWAKAEDERIEAQVAEEIGDSPLANSRRGVKDIWRRIETDSREQEALHSASRKAEGDCIIVGSHGC
jgi:hypothetical protein